MTYEQAMRIVAAFNAVHGELYRHCDLPEQQTKDAEWIARRYDELMTTQGIIPASDNSGYIFPSDQARAEFILKVLEEDPYRVAIEKFPYPGKRRGSKAYWCEVGWWRLWHEKKAAENVESGKTG
jgi:hypothetical protein